MAERRRLVCPRLHPAPRLCNVGHRPGLHPAPRRLYPRAPSDFAPPVSAVDPPSTSRFQSPAAGLHPRPAHPPPPRAPWPQWSSSSLRARRRPPVVRSVHSWLTSTSSSSTSVRSWLTSSSGADAVVVLYLRATRMCAPCFLPLLGCGRSGNRGGHS